MRIKLTLVVLLILIVKCVQTKVLRLGFMSSHNGSLVSSGSIAAAQLAVNYINREKLIRGYDLELIHDLDSGCNKTMALESYFNFWRTPEATPFAPIFIGAGCSMASEPVAAMSRFWNTVQVSFASSSPALSDTSKYPYHFRVIPSETFIHKAQGIFASEFKWKTVGLVSQYEGVFVDDLKSVENFFKGHLGIPLVKLYGFVSRLPLQGLELLWENPPRIIIINAYQPYTREVLCQAYHRKIYYPAYQLVILGWLDDNRWNETTNEGYTSSCSFDDIKKVLNNVVCVAECICRDETINSSLNNMYKEYMKNQELSMFGERAFDAVLTVAHALNKSIIKLKENNLTLENFSFLDESNISNLFADIISDEIRSIEVQGLTGLIQFDERGDIHTTRANITQYRFEGNLYSRQIGLANFNSNTIDLSPGEDISTIFPDGIPRDEIVVINPILFGVMTAAAVCGVCFATVCLLFNLIFMKRRYIKLTSPILNVFICLGAVLSYTEVVLLGIPNDDIAFVAAFCNSSLWIASIGFTLMFGTLVLKTWRIRYIYSNLSKPKIKGKFKDWTLLVALGLLLLVDLAFLGIVTAIKQSRLIAREVGRPLSSKVDLVCTSEALNPVLITFLLYKSIYLWIGLFFAFETRKIKVKALNDAKFIAAAVYCTAVISIPLVIIGLLLTSHVEARYGTLSAGILFVTTVILGLLFLPRMIGLYKRRNDNSVDTALNFTMTDVETSHDVETTLRKQLEVLNERLQKYEHKNTDEVLNGNQTTETSTD